MELRRFDMVSLSKGNVVAPSVIDAWSLLLNHKEKYRATGSPSRFFASTKICLNALAHQQAAHNCDARRNKFFDQLTTELSHYNHTPFSLIDLFVFPVYEDMKYYMITVDARIGTVYVIDSTNETKEDCNIDKYGWIVNDVKNQLGEYFKSRSQTNKGNLVKKTKAVVMQVKWGNNKNTADMGVYMMRHMETYMGGNSMSWTSGLLAKSTRQLRILRVRYCVAMLGWDGNNVKDEVAISAESFHNDLLKNTSVKIHEALLG